MNGKHLPIKQHLGWKAARHLHVNCFFGNGETCFDQSLPCLLRISRLIFGTRERIRFTPANGKLVITVGELGFTDPLGDDEKAERTMALASMASPLSFIRSLLTCDPPSPQLLPISQLPLPVLLPPLHQIHNNMQQIKSSGSGSSRNHQRQPRSRDLPTPRKTISKILILIQIYITPERVTIPFACRPSW